ncbi:MAG TPA: hypothetical protein VJC04_02450 [Candidatus Paceibacterota bacterium]
MKTIFIPIFQGFEARDILRTDIFKKLRQSDDLRIVLFLGNKEKLEYYKNQFSESDKLIYEVFDSYRGGMIDRFFSKLKVYLLKTPTMDIKRSWKLAESGNYFRFILSWFLNRLLANGLVIKLSRFFDYHLIADQNFKKYFDLYKPDLVFLAYLFSDLETGLLREAKKRKVKSIGFVNSWDKLTSRCILRILPDQLIVPNEITKNEATDYQYVPKKLIKVSGAVQFDIYQRLTFSPKEVFMKKFGLIPETKLIVFCPIGRTFSGSDWKFIELLDGFMKNHDLADDIHILVRFPPNDIVELGDNIDKKRFSFVTPGVRFSAKRGVDWDMTEDDFKELADELYHSSLVIAPTSTISIDAAILNKPIINIRFDFVPEKSYESFLRFYHSLHYQTIVESGGIRLARDKKDLLQAIKDYLVKPELNAAGRRKIAIEQTWKLDGKAGERVANLTLDILNKS